MPTGYGILVKLLSAVQTLVLTEILILTLAFIALDIGLCCLLPLLGDKILGRGYSAFFYQDPLSLIP